MPVMPSIAILGLVVSLLFLAVHGALIIWTYSDAKDNSEQPAFL